MMALKTAQFYWIFVGNGSRAFKIVGPSRVFLSFDLAECKRLFQRPQLFHLNNEMFINQGFDVL